ncbi:hypothetical protein NWF24_26550 [Variovorax paradoxus]|uniref:hypothetical protein n=1 Tax=Variovorax paradoxus TaxID=34073 RepID=UPI0021ABE2B0|nr:hypothetical protein [Variovorax paradoxus]UVH56375.1 hypothetical protein NWF24_26550 [Variovorax paradoxus]
MNTDKLDDYLNLLDTTISNLMPSPARNRLEWLRHDLATFAIDTLATNLYRRAWARIVLDRLEAITLPPNMHATFVQTKLELRAFSKGEPLRPLFGQQRIAPGFQTFNINQEQLPGFPGDLANSTLATVQTRIQQGTYSPDQIPIRIFLHGVQQKWIAANNRGYTAHCLAGVRPLRMLPTIFEPTDIEITRLQEVEGENGIGPWTGMRGNEPNPRRLPSERMFVVPIVNAAGSGAITSVASVPVNFV